MLNTLRIQIKTLRSRELEALLNLVKLHQPRTDIRKSHK